MSGHNFFEQQERSQRNSFALGFLMIFAIAGVILAADVALTITLWVIYCLGHLSDAISSEPDLVAIGDGAYHLITRQTWVITSGITLGIIVLGTFRRLFQLRKGSAAIVKLLKARRVHPNTTNFEEHRLLHVVEEMSIASGVGVPPVYLLENEPKINALSAGRSAAEAVIIVTSGAMMQLHREELQAVIAHEFSHIYSGDMALNMRFAGILGGFFAVGNVGLWVAQLGLRIGEGDALALVLLIGFFGGSIFAVGLVGVFGGRLIKSGISRQREFLADARAVQYTRNSDALVGALKKIQAYQRDASGDAEGIKGFVQKVTDFMTSWFRAQKSDELSHMFFSAIKTPKFFKVLSSHPSLEDRLRELGPH
ncbi:M48 family metalloprotease [Bdellovibrionota bacterium FG-1]